MHRARAGMTLRSLLRGSAIYAAGNLLARLGAFVLLPIYLQLMTQSEYGLVALVTSIVGFLSIAYRVGLDGALMRLHFDTEDRLQASLYRTLMISTCAIAAGLSLFLAVTVGPFFEAIFFGVSFVPYGVLALAIAFVTAADYVPAILYRATQQPSKFLIFNLSSFALTSALSLGLVAAGFGAAGALLGQLLGGTVMLGAVVAIAMRPPGRRWLPSCLGPALHFGVPIVPHQISTWTMRLSDRWLLGLLLAVPTTQRLEAIGAYSVGYQLGSLVTMVASSFNAAWTPYFYKVGDHQRGPSIYREILTLSVAGFFWLALGLSALAPEIIGVIANRDYGVAADVLPVIAFGAASQALYTMLVGIIFLRRRTRFLPLITIVSAGTNVGLNLVLIPPMGVMGAAWTTLIAYALFASLTYLFARRIYPLQLDVARLLMIGAVCVGAALFARIMDSASSDILVSGLMHGSVVLVAGALLLPILRGPLRALRHDVSRIAA